MEYSLKEIVKKEIVEILRDTFAIKTEKFVNMLFDGAVEGFYASEIQCIMSTSIKETFAVINILHQHQLVERYYEIMEDGHSKQLYDCLRDIPFSTTDEMGKMKIGYPLDKISVYYKV